MSTITEGLEHFSNGLNSMVYRTTRDQQARFNGADLVRVTNSSWQNMHLMEYARARFAYLLSPGNFPEILGSELGPEIGSRFVDDDSNKPLREHLVFMREIPIPREHQIFSRHAYRDRHDLHKRYDNCHTCQAHLAFHLDHNLRNLAFQLQTNLKRFGIEIDVNDQTDYCVKLGEYPTAQSLAVFETNGGIHGIDGYRLGIQLAIARQRLTFLSQLNPLQQEALTMLDAPTPSPQRGIPILSTLYQTFANIIH